MKKRRRRKKERKKKPPLQYLLQAIKMAQDATYAIKGNK